MFQCELLLCRFISHNEGMTCERSESGAFHGIVSVFILE